MNKIFLSKLPWTPLHTIITVVCLALMTPLTACSSNRIFSNLKGQEGIQTVYISKAMLKLAGSTVSVMDLGKDKDIAKKAIKSIDNIEVVTTSKKGEVLDEQVNQIIKDMNLELLVDVDENNESISIYGQQKQDNDILDMILIYVHEPKETTVVVIHGRIDPAELAKMSTN